VVLLELALANMLLINKHYAQSCIQQLTDSKMEGLLATDPCEQLLHISTIVQFDIYGMMRNACHISLRLKFRLDLGAMRKI